MPSPIRAEITLIGLSKFVGPALLTAMGLLDAAKKTEDWKTDEAGCRQRIQETTIGIARVIVPLCLSLPKKLPKRK